MNAKDIAKALKCCYPPEGNNSCDGCPYEGEEETNCTERNFEYKAGEIIESLLSQLDAAIAGQETLQKEFASLMASADRIDADNLRLIKERDELKELFDSALAGMKILHGELAESQRMERAAVEDLSTYKDCGFCVHVQDQQYCYKNCQRHVDVDNFRTHPCWQWRGPEEGEPHETV